MTSDQDAAFIHPIYQVEPVKILQGEKVEDIRRIISCMEEPKCRFKQMKKSTWGGNLEQVNTSTGSYHQITLTYTPRYCEQVLRVQN